MENSYYKLAEIVVCAGGYVLKRNQYINVSVFDKEISINNYNGNKIFRS